MGVDQVSEAIQIFGMRFLNQFALTVAQSCIAFAAACGDATTWKASISKTRHLLSNLAVLSHLLVHLSY